MTDQPLRRFPLIIDGSKIKELPDGDDLYLRNNNIAEVKDITSLGTISAEQFLVNGKKIQARNFAELEDVPNFYEGSEKFIVRVREDGTGLEFVDFQNLGELNFDVVNAGTVTGDFIGSLFADDSTPIIDAINNTANIGNIRFESNIIKSVGSLILDPQTDILISEGTGLFFQGPTPDEFETRIYPSSVTADRTVFFPDEDGTLATREWVNEQQFKTDISGSVFADDSTLLVDGVNGLITGRIVGPTFDTSNTILLADPEDGNSYYNIRSRDGNDTLLVDAVNGNIPFSVISGAPNFNDGSNSLTLESLTVGTVEISDNIVTGDLTGDVYASDGTKILENNDGTVPATFTGNVTGNITSTNGNVSTFTNIDINSGSIDNTVIGSDTPNSITGTTVIATTEFIGTLTGNVVGDIKGSIFADDSTLLVDAVNGSIPWDVISGTPTLDVDIAGGVVVPLDANFDINVEDSGIGASIFRITDTGIVQVPGTITSFGINTNLDIESNGTGNLSLSDGQNGLFLDGTTGALSIASTGTVTLQGAAGADLNIGTGTTGTVTIGSGSNTIDFPAGTNIDFTGANITGNTAEITETDPVFTASVAFGIAQSDIDAWNAAVSYTESDTLESVTTRGNTTTNSITVGGLSTESLTVTGTGSSTIQSGNDIVLQATNRTRVEGTPFRVAQMTSTERNAIGAQQDGDIIFNTTVGKFQVSENGAWNDLTTSGSLEIPNYEVVDFSSSGSRSIGSGSLLLDSPGNTVEVNIAVTFFSKIEISMCAMINFGGAQGIIDRTIAIERSINGGTPNPIVTTVASIDGPTNITFVDTHGAANGDTLTYTFRNTTSNGTMTVSYGYNNQIIAREV